MLRRAAVAGAWLGAAALLTLAICTGQGCGGTTHGIRTGAAGASGEAIDATTTGADGAPAPGFCDVTSMPTDPLLADFSVDGQWGTTGPLVGSPFAYGGAKMTGTMKSSMVSDSIMGGHFALTGVVVAADYSGAGLAFGTCADASAYSGVQFTVDGAADGCDFLFMVQTFEEQAANNHGGCNANADAGISCFKFPQIKLASTSGTMTVLWSDLANTGIPVSPDDIKTRIVGLQWQFQATGSGNGCPTIAVNIDNVKFVQ